jgi:hypothetical protein
MNGQAVTRFRLDARKKGGHWYRQKTYPVDSFRLACAVVDQGAKAYTDVEFRVIAMPADVLVHSSLNPGAWAEA